MRGIRERIIHEAATLFTEKGFHPTSVQDIVKKSEISKGSFYNHFKSKDELALVIVKELNALKWRKMGSVKKQGISVKEQFMEQLTIHLNHVIKARELLPIVLQISQENKELRFYLYQSQTKDIRWLSQQFSLVYGEEKQPFIYDCALIFIGLVHSYFIHLYLVEQKEISMDAMTTFLIRRMDAIMESFNEEDSPLLKEQLVQDLMRAEKQERIYLTKQIQSLILHIRSEVDSMLLKESNRKKVYDCLETLGHEFESNEPRDYIVEGLLLYLKNLRIHELEKQLAHLSSSIHSYWQQIVE